MILHIPHSSSLIPDRFRDQIVLSDDDLNAELLLMTDAFTDEIFSYPGVRTVRFPMSRLLVDVERFPEDIREPMSKVGMGMIYTLTAHGRILKRMLQPQEARILFNYYESHHGEISNAINIELQKYDNSLIVDCHSFPNNPLPCDKDQMIPRPDFCIGTDSFHTPERLVRISEFFLKKLGYKVEINQPYAGTLVPDKFSRKDTRVGSIMIEVNRSLYMDERTGGKKDSFESIKNAVQSLLYSMDSFQRGS